MPKAFQKSVKILSVKFYFAKIETEFSLILSMQQSMDEIQALRSELFAHRLHNNFTKASKRSIFLLFKDAFQQRGGIGGGRRWNCNDS